MRPVRIWAEDSLITSTILPNSCRPSTSLPGGEIKGLSSLCAIFTKNGFKI